MKRLFSFAWRQWLKRLFIALHFLLYTALIGGSALLYVAYRPDGLELVNAYVFKPLGVRYTHAEGSLLEGFTLHNLKTENTEAETFVLQYNLTKILKGDHTIDSIRIDGLRIEPEDFTGDSDSVWPFPTFKLREVTLKNLQLTGSYPIELDLYGKNGTYDGDELDLASVEATFKSRYASGAIRGTVRRNALRGVSDIYPNGAELAPYSGRYTVLPQKVRVKIQELSDKKALLHTALGSLSSKQDPLLRADSIVLDLEYVYENGYADLDAAYVLNRDGDSMKTVQRLRYMPEGKTTLTLDGVITSSRPLPAKALHAELSDDQNGLRGKVALGGSVLGFATKDYEHYDWKLQSRNQSLAFIRTLPDSLRSSPFVLDADGSYAFESDTLKGSVHAEHDDFHFKGVFSTREGRHRLDGNVTLPSDAPLWKTWAHKPPEHLQLFLSDESNATRLNLSGDSLSLRIALAGGKIQGSGNYLGTFFDLGGSATSAGLDIDLSTVTPSVFATLSKIRPVELLKGEYYDAEIRTKTHVTFTDTLHLQSSIEIPWYAAVLDSQRAYGGTEGKINLAYRDGAITVENYRLEIANHPLATDKVSRLHLTAEGGVRIDELWIYDTLLLSGTINSDLSASLRLHSDRFSYHGPEGSAQASADIAFVRDVQENQSLTGTVKILDAQITYLPLQEFKVMDSDIIIVQDVRPPSRARLAMNIHVTAQKLIRFKTKELDLGMDPDITLWKEGNEPMQILGMVTIPSGTAVSAGKSFDIKHSEIYFGGDVPINPYLDITIGHEVDYNKISIFITHTLDAPIFLFSSDPVMSQNDIMSYLLFGTPANTISGGGDRSTSTVRADATNFMLGAGLKGLIKGATKLQLDTMNILTTAQGGMGFEVGARLNKDLRVLYKNDTVSSVLVQYSVNRWLRLDADIHELGQGINAIYIKDFRDFLPHNLPKKK